MFTCRENLEWLARATNWAKFTATASLGVIHKVNLCHYGKNTAQSQKGTGVCFPDGLYLTMCINPGVVQGHEKEALQLMATYLPKDTSPGSAYQEGGGLYALGLIHANHGGDIIDYLLSQLKNASNDVSCLKFFFWMLPKAKYEDAIADIEVIEKLE